MIQTINVMEVYTKEILFPGEPSILLLTYPFEEYLFDLPHTSHGEKTLRVQDGSMDLLSGSPLQLIFWKLPAVEFGCCIKEKYQLSKKKKRLFTYSSFSNPEDDNIFSKFNLNNMVALFLHLTKMISSITGNDTSDRKKIRCKLARGENRAVTIPFRIRNFRKANCYTGIMILLQFHHLISKWLAAFLPIMKSVLFDL